MPGFWDQFGREAQRGIAQGPSVFANIMGQKRETTAAKAAQEREDEFRKKEGLWKRLGVLQKMKPGAARAEAYKGIESRVDSGLDDLGDLGPIFKAVANERVPQEKPLIHEGNVYVQDPMSDSGYRKVIESKPKTDYEAIPGRSDVLLKIVDGEIAGEVNMSDYTYDETVGGEIQTREVSPGQDVVTGTRPTATTALNQQEFEYRKKVAAEKEAMTPGGKLPASSQKRLEQVSMVQETAQKILNMLNEKDPNTGEFSKDAKSIRSYMGGGKAWWNRAFSSEGSSFLMRTPQEVVTFMAFLEHARDIVQRKATGAAMNKSEEEFYKTLVGAMGMAPESFQARMEVLIDQMNQNADLITQGVQSGDPEIQSLKDEALQGSTEALDALEEKAADSDEALEAWEEAVKAQR